MSKILGQSQLTKSLAEQTGNAKLHLISAQNFTKQTQIAFNSFSRDLEKITADLTILREKIRKNPTQIKKYFHDKFTPVEDTLVMAEQGQRQQNKINQENMTEIKRENRQTTQSMLRTFQKLKVMEVRVGQYE